MMTYRAAFCQLWSRCANGIRQKCVNPRVCVAPLLAVPAASRAWSSMADNYYTMFDPVLTDDIYNLVMGAPSETVLKMAAVKFQEAVNTRMREELPQWLMHYGPYRGDGKFLDAMSTFLTDQYGTPVARDDLVVTAGATMGFSLLTNLLFERSDLVFVEDPTYFVATKVIRQDYQMSMVSVPTDSDGIVPEALERVLESKRSHKPRELTEKRPFWGMLYLISTIHNPTGVTLSPERCRRVVELARQYNLLVVCDDVYNLLYFGDKPPHRLFQFDSKTDSDYKGNVVSNGSISKIFSPGCRLGWMEVPPRLRDILMGAGYLDSGGGWNHTMSGLIARVVSSGALRDTIELARPLYREQCEATCEVLRTQLPDAQFVEPTGGYFLWVKLPDNLSGTEVATRLREQFKTLVLPGPSFSIGSGHFPDYVRVGFNFNNSDRMRQSMEHLVTVVKAIQAGK